MIRPAPDASLRTPARAPRSGGGEGRNAFQRPKDEAIQLLHAVMDIFAKA